MPKSRTGRKSGPRQSLQRAKKPEPGTDVAEATSVHIERRRFSGPVPPPEILAQYDQVLPGAADRILQMAEREQLAAPRRYGAVNAVLWFRPVRANGGCGARIRRPRGRRALDRNDYPPRTRGGLLDGSETIPRNPVGMPAVRRGLENVRPTSNRPHFGSLYSMTSGDSSISVSSARVSPRGPGHPGPFFRKRMGSGGLRGLQIR